MKRAIIMALVALSMGLLAAAASKPGKTQPAKGYVKVDKELIKKAAETVVNGEKDLNAKDKSYYKDLLEKAFVKYAAGKASKVEVYEKETVERLKSENRALQDSMKQLRRSLADLRKALKKGEGHVNVHNAWCREDSIAREITALKAEISSLRADIAAREQSTGFAAGDSMADILWGKVDELYSEYLNSQELQYVDPAAAEKTVSDYEAYLATLGAAVPASQREKIELIRAVAMVAGHYHDGMEILSKKYDSKAVRQWKEGVKSLSASVARLNSGQKTVWQNVVNAFSTIDDANAHFKGHILPFLKEQEQIPSGAEAKAVNDLVRKQVHAFASGRYKDTKGYHELHKHLNAVLDAVLSGLTVMDAKQYSAFVKTIENSL